MSLFFVVYVYNLYRHWKLFFLVIGQLDDTTITGPDLVVVLYVLWYDQLDLLISLNVCDSCRIYPHIDSICVYLDMFFITKYQQKQLAHSIIKYYTKIPLFWPHFESRLRKFLITYMEQESDIS